MVRKNLLKGFQFPQNVSETPTDEPGLSQFVISPFDAGFATTVGNTLRRVLLSSIQGIGVVEARIAYLSDSQEMHTLTSEFESLPVVHEETVEIVRALRQVVFTLPEDVNERTIKIDWKGSGVCTGKDLQVDQVEVITPDVVIFTASQETEISLELVLRVGRGFVPAAMQSRTLDVIGAIVFDTYFSPIRKVQYKVEEEGLDPSDMPTERLVMRIWSNGSVNNAEALAEAAKIAKEFFIPLISFDESLVQTNSEATDYLNMRIEKLLDTPIEELELSVRSSNCLRSAGIENLRDLTAKSEADLSQTKNFGKKSLLEIKEKLKEWNLTLGMTDYKILHNSLKFTQDKGIDDES